MSQVLERDIITIKDIDNKFAKEVNEFTEDTLIRCIDCGACTGSCPSGRRTALRVRKILRLARLGYRDVLKLADLWLCTTCYTCYDRCPQQVNTVDAVIKLRNYAFRSGYALEPHKRVAKLVIEYGHAVPINDENKKLRVSMGLPELPPTVHKYPEALEQVKKILELTGFSELLKV